MLFVWEGGDVCERGGIPTLGRGVCVCVRGRMSEQATSVEIDVACSH